MEHVIDRLGGTTAVARMLGISAPSVTFWRTRGIPAERCVALERAVDGRVTCEEMSAHVRWVRLPDAAWPWHPMGRPLLDLAASLPAVNAVGGGTPETSASAQPSGAESDDSTGGV
jgi:Putative antitoxin of bacterial toxin-antitoxin system, YdaS/YdaT